MICSYQNHFDLFCLSNSLLVIKHTDILTDDVIQLGVLTYIVHIVSSKDNIHNSTLVSLQFFQGFIRITLQSTNIV